MPMGPFGLVGVFKVSLSPLIAVVGEGRVGRSEWGKTNQKLRFEYFTHALRRQAGDPVCMQKI
jgi:hypothetical protein